MSMIRMRPKLTLPSGRAVRLTKGVDPRRPWEVEQVGRDFVVSRVRRGDSSRREPYQGEDLLPLVLDRVDAEALAKVLNTFVRPRMRAMVERRGQVVAEEARGSSGQASGSERAG